MHKNYEMINYLDIPLSALSLNSLDTILAKPKIRDVIVKRMSKRFIYLL